MMKDILENLGATPIGYRYLVDTYHLRILLHFRWSYIIKRGTRRVLQETTPITYIYDQAYALDDHNDPLQHLTFALKHEGMNLEIINAFFQIQPSGSIHEHIAKNSNGKYERIIWFLYEMFMQQTLDLPDLVQGSYIDLVDTDLYYTANPIPHRRHRINDNLLGNRLFCPLVRKTDTLKKYEEKHLDQLVRSIIKEYGQAILDRASMYLYTQETLSSYRIEREQPNKQRVARFIQLVKKIEHIAPLTKEVLTELQQSVVDVRYANKDYRSTQNYIGQSHTQYGQIVHYISPKPDDVPELMQGLLDALSRMLQSDVHPIITAATISFGFVFIHPFDDGNGRLHRFLIHYVLYRMGFTPPGMIFPISATILLHMDDYNRVLEHFSKPLMVLLSDYALDDQGRLTVHQKTDNLYRFIDYTSQAEFLASCIEKTIHTDFQQELKYLVQYDAAKRELQEIVDMPDRFIDLFIRIVLQNNGVLSESRRKKHFPELTDHEVREMVGIINRLFSQESRNFDFEKDGENV